MNLSYAVRGASTAQRMRAQMKRTGQTSKGHWLWTREEDQKVIRLYPDYKTLRKVLRRRTFRGIKARACSLGVTKKRHTWTGVEITKLRKLYPAASREEIMAAFSGLRWSQICARAQYAGFRRDRKLYKKTGHEVLDEIRQRAFDLRLTMVDLDEMARTKTYFQKAGWHGHATPNPRAVARAIDALAGKIRVEWE